MKYVSTSDLRNPYPLDNNPTEGNRNTNYTSKVGYVNLEGKFNSSKEQIIQESNLSSLQVLSEKHTFRFILNIDNQLITSRPFYNDLLDAQRENNPYFIIENSAIIDFNFNELITPYKDFSISERYAEVNVTSNLNKGGNVLLKIVDHIDWLVKKDNQKLRSYNELGSWQVLTTSYNPSTDTGLAVELTNQVEEERLKPTNEIE